MVPSQSPAGKSRQIFSLEPRRLDAFRASPLPPAGAGRYNAGGAGNGKAGRAMLNYSSGFRRKTGKHFVGGTG